MSETQVMIEMAEADARSARLEVRWRELEAVHPEVAAVLMGPDTVEASAVELLVAGAFARGVSAALNAAVSGRRVLYELQLGA